MNAPLDLTVLASAWLRAKADEEAARERRYEVERQICALAPNEAVEATVTPDVDGFKIKVAYGVTRKVDTDKLQGAWMSLPPAAQDAFRWKAEIKARELRALQSLLPEVYATLAGFIETKPSKPTVTIEPKA